MPSGFRPVYFRGLGERKEAAEDLKPARALLLPPAAASRCFEADADSFGVLCTPVTCVGLSTEND